MSAHLKPLAKIGTTRDQKLGAGRWLTLHEVAFNDPSGIERRWEVCRRSNAENKPDGEQSVDGNVTALFFLVLVCLILKQGLTLSVLVYVSRGCRCRDQELTRTGNKRDLGGPVPSSAECLRS